MEKRRLINIGKLRVKRKYRRVLKRFLAVLMVIAVSMTSLQLENFAPVVHAETAYTTLYLVDDTAEHWIGNDNAVIELVDNTYGHDRYIMTKVSDNMWSVRVPVSTYNVTFNRYNSAQTTQWNSWSAGGRDNHNAYHALGHEYGYWDGNADLEEGFHAGDVVYLDYYEFMDWEKSDTLFYVNFTDVSKADNGGKDIVIKDADRTKFAPVLLTDEIEEGVYKYIVSEEEAGATELRFWRGNKDTLWNNSVTLAYSDYKEGNNCAKVQGWNDTGYVCPYVPRRHITRIDSMDIRVEGSLKVNRKITLDLDIEGETDRLNKENTEIIITKEGGETQDAAVRYDEDAAAWNHRELLFKEAGTYKITAVATDGTDEFPVTKIISIAEDMAPVPDFDFDVENRTYIRDEKGTAVVNLTDASASEAGDTITERIWKLYYDADQDGTYTEEELVDTKKGNETKIKYSLQNVGKYKVSLRIQEHFDDTIESLIDGTEYLRGDTGEKPEEEVVFEITNQAPSSSMSIQKSRTADIIFTVGNADGETLEQYAAETGKVQEYMEQQGIHAKVSTVSTSALTAQDTFAWKEYDHYNYKDGSHPALEKHIIYDGDDIVMLGYPSSPIKDFLYVEDNDSSRKVFEFDLQRDGTDWHSIEGGGFLFNTIVSDEENYIQGYCVLVAQSGLKLVQISKTDLNKFRNGGFSSVAYAGRLLQTFRMKNLYDEHHLKMIVDKNILTVYDGDTLLVDQYVLPDDEVEAYGYGPIISHDRHGCNQQSYFTFKNIVMQTIKGESLSNVVNGHDWTSGTNHYVINLSQTSVPELSDTDRMADVAGALISSDAAFFGIGNDDAISQYSALTNTLDKKGSNFILKGKTGETEESTDLVSVEEAVSRIETLIAADVKKGDYEIGSILSTDEEVEYSNTYQDKDGDPAGSQEWTYVYDKSAFGEDTGNAEKETLVKDEPITMFKEAGAYEISLRVSDDPTKGNAAMESYIRWSDTDQYKKLILSQHRPAARVEASVMQSKTDKTKCLVNVSYDAYDEDHPLDAKKGIRSEQFYYKEIHDTEWTKGKMPASVSFGTTYLVKYVVTDVEGTESRPAVCAVKSADARTYEQPEDTTPPEVSLSVSKTVAELGEEFYVEASATDDYGITEFHIYVNGQELASSFGRFGYTPEEAGEYEVTVEAEDIGGNVGKAAKTVSVVDNRDTTPPQITITSPKSGTITGAVDIIGSITDNEQIRAYTVTQTKCNAGEETAEPVVLASGDKKVEDAKIATVNTDGLEPGVYKIEITAEDTAGLSTVCSIMLTVEEKESADRTPPQAAISDICLSGDKQMVMVSGSVSDETAFDRYELKLYPEGDGENDAIVIAEGTSAVENEILGTILSENLENGDYCLVLTAWDKGGNSCTAGAGFTYEKGTEEEIGRKADTAPPVILAQLGAEITEEGLHLKLEGTVTDDNLKYYRVITGKADENNLLTDSIDIAEGDEPVTDGMIADYTYKEYEAGNYGVQIQAEDKAGNTRCAWYTVTVTAQGTILDGYEGEERGDSLNLVLSKNMVDAGETIQAYLTYPASATDVKLTAGGRNIAIQGRTAEIVSTEAGELEVVLSAVVDGEEKSVSSTVRFLNGADKTHPKADILSPEPESTIKVKTDIRGTVSDEQGLSYYTLEYRMEGADSYTLICRGTEAVEEEVLGTLDTSLLENGRYILRLTAVDNGGNCTKVEQGLNVEGNLKVGNMSIGFTDIDSKVSGVPLTATRCYDSRNKESGDFGTGWRLALQSVSMKEASDITEGYEMVQTGSFFSTTYQIVQNACHDITVMYGDGTSDRFELKVSPERRALVPIYEVEVEFACVTNQKVKLELAGDHTAMLAGGSLLFEADEMQDSRSYILTREDGTKLYLDEAHGLMKIEDTSGNTVKISKNGFTHSDGKGITFTRDEQGRIIKAQEKKDAVVSTITYAYDSRDDLISVTDDAGRTVSFTYDDNHNLIDIIDPSGIAVGRNEYDEEGRLVAVIDADGNRTEYTHDVEGRTEVVKDRRGNTTVYTYDDNGNVLQTTDAYGNKTKNTYDAYNNLLSTTDANGNTTSYVYDSSGNVTEVTAADGTKVESTYTQGNYVAGIRMMDKKVMAMDYDNKGRISSVEDANGNVTEYSYTSDGKLTGLTDAIGEYQKITYDADGNVAATTNGAGESASYTYDEKGRCTSVIISREENGETLNFTSRYTYNETGDIVQSMDNAGNVTAYEYDASGNQTASVDAKSRRITYEYDHLGNMVKTTYPDGTFESFTYDANGNNVTATDRTGQTVTMKYDKLDRMTEKAYADGTKESYVYDKAGNVTEMTSTSGAKTKYTYDERYRNTAITDTYGNVTSFEYDASARLTRRMDAEGNETVYAYDDNGNITKTTYADGNSVTSEYDARNRVTRQEDQNGNETIYTYDGADRLTKVTDAYGNSYSYGYDGNGNLVTVTDANGNVTRYTYDEVGRVKTVQNALGKKMEYTYDSVGNVTAFQDYAGTKTTYKYDTMDRLTEKSVRTEKTFYSYDEKGRLAGVTDKSGDITYQYDAYDRLTKKTDAGGVTLSYTYDDTGRLHSFDNGFGTTTYEYDLLDRVTKVIDRNGKATLYEYDALGNRSAVRYPNGNVVTYTYDACQRLKEEWIVNESGVTLAKYTYGLGKAGERISVTEWSNGEETETAYRYDKLNRLVKETIERNQNKLTYEYSYDAVSNCIEKTVSIKGDISALADVDLEEVQVTEGTTTYTYNALNQLVAEASPEENISYTYDDNGNLVKQTGSKTVDYTYDRENHLTKATIQQGNSVTIESYTYDYAGNRLSKIINESDITYYVNDTSADLTMVVAETDKDGKEKAYYTRGDELLSMERNGEVCYYLYDGHGSVRTLTNEAGRVTDRYSYDAYGNLLKKEGGTENEFLYTGEQYNANTGLYYLRARYMNPSTGTFISMDSYQGSVYDPISLHKYLYANANPVMYTDPSGYSSAVEAGTYMECTNLMTISEALYNTVIFSIGMKILAQLRAIKAVETVTQVSSETILNIGVEDALSGTSNKEKVSSELLMKAVNAVTLAYLIASDCIALDIVSNTVEAVRTDIEANAIELTRENRKQFKGHCVYVLRDSQNQNKVAYVGRTKNPWKRRLAHRRDKTKQTNGIPWDMYIVKDKLNLKQAETLENALICIYTIDALANARHEIAVKNFEGFEQEFSRAASICKIPLGTLYDVMKGDYK